MSYYDTHRADEESGVAEAEIAFHDSGLSAYTSFQHSITEFTAHDNDVSEDDDDHMRLFAIIEEGMPRPNDRMDANQRKQITEMTYERVRNWLRRHTNLRIRQVAIAVRGNNDATPLHNVCKLHNPPADIIEAFIEAVPEAAGWVDTHGWLPLHHACANGASGEVLRTLTEAYPEGKTKQDSQNRTPLHFFLTQRCDNANTMADNMALLLDTGAAELTDVGGMLPMHYACAYGVSPIVLLVLAQVFPESLVTRENKGRTPMHLAMVNAHREAIPGVIRFLLESCGPEICNVRDYDGYLPLHLLALGLRGIRSESMEQRNSVAECLSLYLGAEPHASADFLTSLQDLPEWLLDVAVVTPHVRNVLNKKIVKRLPTLFLIMDGYWYIILVICFQVSTTGQIDNRFEFTSHNVFTSLIFVFLGGAWFVLRELLQIISMWSLGGLSKWFWDPTNWIDVSLIILVFYYAVQMKTEDSAISNNAFRTGVAFTKGVIWIGFISFLKSTLVEFSVFVGGVGYVLRRLLAFLMALAVILFAFAQMFFIIYYNTPVCEKCAPDDEECQECPFPHCNYAHSLLKVYTMMLGELGNDGSARYSGNLVAQILFVIYSFLVVILLSNVLIAIVTDSYEVVQNDRAAVVFWSNRLDFVAECDAISYGIRNKLGYLDDYDGEGGIGNVQEGPGGRSFRTSNTSSKSFFADGWRNLVQLFDEHLYDDVDFNPTNVDFWCHFLCRALAVIFIIPLWILAGVATAGWLWPPQVREWLFVQKETAISRSDLEKQKLEQLKEIQNGMRVLKADIRKELASGRDEIMRIKTEMEGAHYGIASDLQQVRELMTTLLDMGQASRSEGLSRGSREF